MILDQKENNPRSGEEKEENIMETMKEMRLYSVERSRKLLKELLKGKDIEEYIPILAELALEDEDAEACDSTEKGDIYFVSGTIGMLANISFPFEVEFEVDEDGDYIQDIGLDYSEDVFPASKLEWLKGELFD